MIKNERQYKITLAQIGRFRQALEDLRTSATQDSSVPAALVQAQEDALQSQLDELCAQIDEYEALRTGKKQVLEIVSFDDLPKALIQARIAAGLTQKQLAKRLGLKEQQIQLYESTEYAGASLARIQEVIHALGVQVRMDIRPAS